MAKSNTLENHPGGLDIMTWLRLNLAASTSCKHDHCKQWSTWIWRIKISANILLRTICHGMATVILVCTRSKCMRCLSISHFSIMHLKLPRQSSLFSRKRNHYSLDSESIWQRISAVSFKSKTWWNAWSSGTVCRSYKGFIVLASIATADAELFTPARPASDWCAQPTSRSAGQWQRLLDAKSNSSKRCLRSFGWLRIDVKQTPLPSSSKYRNRNSSTPGNFQEQSCVNGCESRGMDDSGWSLRMSADLLPWEAPSNQLNLAKSMRHVASLSLMRCKCGIMLGKENNVQVLREAWASNSLDFQTRDSTPWRKASKTSSVYSVDDSKRSLQQKRVMFSGVTFLQGRNT